MDKFTFKCVTYFNEEDRRWICHCLELDIVACGDTPEQAETDMPDLIETQIEFAKKHNSLEYIFRPAPAEIWSKLAHCLMGAEIEIKKFRERRREEK